MPVEREGVTLSRRSLLGVASGGAMLGVPGWLGNAPRQPGRGSLTFDTGTNRGPPTTDRSLLHDYDLLELNVAMEDSTADPDEIPAIDEPKFRTADDPTPALDDGDPIFGVAMDGEAKAYPQRILVWHEIVNDEIGGRPIAVTYCPLTGTAQGFHRGNTRFGVTGRLLNSNLIAFDRASETPWSQMLALGLGEPNRGAYLDEFRVVWTTWQRWRQTYPETFVLTQNTGYIRNYDRDPYGWYNPRGGYYDRDGTLYAPLATDDRLHEKAVVLGVRTADGPFAVRKESLRASGVVEGSVGGVPYAIVYDDELDTGRAYRNTANASIEADDSAVLVNGERYSADSLPLDSVIAIDAMWFAWYGFFPSTVLLGKENEHSLSVTADSDDPTGAVDRFDAQQREVESARQHAGPVNTEDIAKVIGAGGIGLGIGMARLLRDEIE